MVITYEHRKKMGKTWEERNQFGESITWVTGVGLPNSTMRKIRIEEKRVGHIV
jgi:hypothetical protein